MIKLIQICLSWPLADYISKQQNNYKSISLNGIITLVKSKFGFKSEKVIKKSNVQAV